jgi:hypothetical protein
MGRRGTYALLALQQMATIIRTSMTMGITPMGIATTSTTVAAALSYRTTTRGRVRSVGTWRLQRWRQPRSCFTSRNTRNDREKCTRGDSKRLIADLHANLELRRCSSSSNTTILMAPTANRANGFWANVRFSEPLNAPMHINGPASPWPEITAWLGTR